MSLVRETITPATPAPYWVPPVSMPGGLLYLAWGRRQYGKNPIPQRLHDGWTFTLVTHGSPLALVADRKIRLQPDQLLLVGPDCPLGWGDDGDNTCSILVWIWQSVNEELRPHASGYLKGRADEEGLEWLQQLHLLSRRELQRSDVRTKQLLHSCRQLLEVFFLRACSGELNTEARDERRLRLAYAWMQQHIHQLIPMSALADYLGVSPMGLQRLFKRHTGDSPGSVFHKMRMQAAQERLKKGDESVKAVGLSFGYRHAGDFTRAYKAFFGINASER